MRLLHRTNLAILLINAFSKQIIRNATIFLNENFFDFVIKDDGYCVFYDLEPSEYKINIICPGFKDKEIKIETEENGIVIIKQKIFYSIDSPFLRDSLKFEFHTKNLKNQKIILEQENNLNFLKLANPIEKDSREVFMNIQELDTKLLYQDYIYFLNEVKTKLPFDGYDIIKNCYLLKEPAQNKIESGGKFKILWDLETDNLGKTVLPYSNFFMKRKNLVFCLKIDEEIKKFKVDLSKELPKDMTFRFNL
ncbi:MAG: hypothetical protein RsTaC01_0530 [Candidatus Paraimprobicoccus trichonymphae]|uniref:Carboxypeptidase-like regulatory domain-containing protein n=1 Tax=Candidatus Paraimprobicoccus trichonymphae TaxID=3033793 RepID=A0AA48HZM9_9FIRM|nr:MAG: hypothetical protein RsTaC01_0530 [Candidatus Paraimprobicoccus trichonymphae]